MKMYQEALQMISFLSSIIITDAGHLIVAIYGPRCVYVFCITFGVLLYKLRGPPDLMDRGGHNEALLLWLTTYYYLPPNLR